MVMVHLVRHGRSIQDRSKAAEFWALDPAGLADIEALRAAEVLPSYAVWRTSPEPKARMTAEALAVGPVAADHRLKEQVRDARWYADPAEFRATVHRALTAPEVPAVDGWEAVRQTADRVVSALRELAADTGRSAVVAVGHGTAWTAAIAELTDSQPDMGGWERMGFPDHCSLDLDTRRVVADWGSWRS
jgi:broad specificity phosphatase PhoE